MVILLHRAIQQCIAYFPSRTSVVFSGIHSFCLRVRIQYTAEFGSQSGHVEWLIDRNPLLLVTERRSCSDEKDLVSRKCSVRQLLSRGIDDITITECDLF